MAKLKSGQRVRKCITVLGLVAAMFAGTMALTGCSSKELKQAQDNIDTQVTMVLNQEDIEKQDAFSDFTFLCADVEKADGNNYNVDINGVSNYQNIDDKAYTTLNYTVDGGYFNEETTKNNATIINALAEIVGKEKCNSVQIVNVSELENLNEALGKAVYIPLNGYKYSNNFVYNIENVNFSEQDNVASFSTGQLSKFSKTTTQVTYGIVGYSNGKPRYGMVTRTHTDYESFFMNHNVYVKLTPEEMEAAKTDQKVIFNKFVEYVKTGQKDKYVIEQTNIAQEKEFDANQKGDVQLGDI